ncbi:thiopeptide maturation pyridine synthase [Thermogemmatispora carboxidivorans]|uniref:thiopeptide maturation pyridine synthase n=1 Tax=Thermogemmatispora carboxidivorans TaxID=1382306 RepID=UPI00069A3B11|nr:thiopeptide maturation pyridine synthase [Thermogemmatispora carboxidivorans]
MSGSSVARPEACAWQSAHVYYYDEQKDALLLDCIQPLFAQARPITPRLFFVRHWLRGPHLRLRFYCSSMQFAATLKPLIESTVGGYLRQHPSTTRLDEEQLKPLYATLARQEQETGPLFPLYPDNSIQYLPYDRRLQVLGSEALASLLEDFYVDTNDLAFAMLAYLRQGHSLLTLCFDLMITVAHRQGQHLARGFLSYRSHAEGFIIASSDPARTRALLESRYQQQARTLVARLRQLLAALDRAQDTFPFTLAWSQLMQRYQERAAQLITTGQIDLSLASLETGEGDSSSVRRNLAASAFHSALERDQERKQALYSDPWFQSYRLVLNLLYLHFSRLGLRPLDRFLLCHLAANAVEEALKIDAVEMVSAFSAGAWSGPTHWPAEGGRQHAGG